ncbi:MAG: acyl-CoA thioesterase [Helicobacteraceae bacterium]|nr:acyl-CoA thioesterase [Helicobacteraceae bacterium]
MRELSLKTVVFPRDMWAGGHNAFGGWIMGQMDIAASVRIQSFLTSGALTITVSNMHFKKPVHVGDIVNVYTDVTAIGNTSITMKIDVEVVSHATNTEHCVTEAEFKFVAVDENGSPISVADVVRGNVKDKDILKLLNEK